MSYELCEKIRSLTPYEPITGSYKIRLDANESYLELPEHTAKDMLERISACALNRYPDPAAAGVCELFAKYHGINVNNVVAGNGSDELLSILTQSFLMRGEQLAVVAPDFSMYAFYGSIAECKVDVFRKNDDFTFSVDDLADFINTNGPRMLIFSNPCNPTGAGLCRDDVLRLTENCPNCLIVADEAYMDFWDQSVINKVCDYDNLLVLRTCSKAFRMAGIRCGFAVGNEKLINAFKAVKSPYNVSMLTQSAAEAILSYPEELQAACRELTESRAELEAELRDIAADSKIGIIVRPSCTNFVYLSMDRAEAVKIFEQLKQRSIIIRCLGNGLRITAGSKDENRELLAQLRNILC